MRAIVIWLRADARPRAEFALRRTDSLDRGVMKRLVLVKFLAALTAAASMACAWPAHAQPFPNKPMRWIVPFPAGGPADILTRLIAERVSENVGQRVLVDNRAGASGIIGTELAVKAPPDGYTLVWGIA